MIRRRTVSWVASLLAATLVAPMLAALPAAADGTPEVPDPVPGQNAFPQSMQFLVQNTPEFTARYFGASRQLTESEGLPDNSPLRTPLAGAPTCQGRGGDIGLYTIDFTRHLGDVIWGTASASQGGHTSADFPTTPWPGSAASDMGTSDSGGVMPLPSWWQAYNRDGDHDGQFTHLPDPSYITSCGADLAPFGKPDSESPWGFAFYPEPDRASMTQAWPDLINSIPATTTRSGRSVVSAADSWADMSHALNRWQYSPAQPMGYCDSGDKANPWCLTAMFMHCPELPASTAANYQAVKDCRTFNVNTLLLNMAVGNWINTGGGSGPFAGWVETLDHGAGDPAIMKWVKAGVLLAAGGLVVAASGGLATIGLARLAAMAAVGAVTLTGNWDTVWGVAVCSAQIDKCLAEAAAKSLSQSSQLVSESARAAAPPSLASYGSVFNRFAGLSAIIMLILLFLTLCYAVLTGKLGLMIPAAIGVFKWGVAIGAGTVLLTMAFDASTAIADAIAGAGGAAGQIATFTDQISVTAMNLGSATTIIGWLMVALAAVIGTLAAIIVWIVLSMSYQFIPLAIGLMILQVSGFTGSEGARKWIHRGWGVLWTILMLRPAVTLLTKFAAMAGISAGSSGSNVLVGFLAGVVILVLAALAPWLIVKMFPLAAAGGIGAVQGLLAAGNAAMLASRLPGAGKAMANRAAGLGRLMGMGRGGAPKLATAGAAAGVGVGSVAGAAVGAARSGADRAAQAAGFDPRGASTGSPAMPTDRHAQADQAAPQHQGEGPEAASQAGQTPGNEQTGRPMPGGPLPEAADGGTPSSARHAQQGGVGRDDSGSRGAEQLERQSASQSGGGTQGGETAGGRKMPGGFKAPATPDRATPPVTPPSRPALPTSPQTGRQGAASDAGQPGAGSRALPVPPDREQTNPTSVTPRQSTTPQRPDATGGQGQTAQDVIPPGRADDGVWSTGATKPSTPDQAGGGNSDGQQQRDRGFPGRADQGGNT